MLIKEHSPIALGLAEVNIAHDCHEAPLKIDNYKLERDNLAAEGLTTRVAVYILATAQYRRRQDLEPMETPLIWIEFNADTKSSWLLCIAYREWRTQNPKTKLESGTPKNQLIRLEAWETSLVKASNEKKTYFSNV